MKELYYALIIKLKNKALNNNNIYNIKNIIFIYIKLIIMNKKAVLFIALVLFISERGLVQYSGHGG